MMKRSPWRIGAAAVVFGGLGLIVGSGAGVIGREQPVEPADKATESYSVGFDAGRELAQNLKADGLELDRAALMQGITDGLEGKATRVSEPDMRRVLAALHRRVGEERAKKRCESDPVFRAMCDENALRSKAALEEFAKRSGAVKLPGGVVYQVIRKGDGDRAEGSSGVVVSYHASLINGQPVAYGDGATIEMAGLMPGAQELLGAMRIGDRVSAIVPPASAFGLAGRDGDVGPNEAVLLDVELLSVRK